MKCSKKLLTILLTSMIVLASCSNDSSESDGDTEVVLADFKLVGATIVDPEGNVFIPVGANIGAPLIDSEEQPVWLFRFEGHDITSEESVAAVEAWGWNTLRLNATCTATDANEFNSEWGNEEMFAAIDRVVDAYTSRQIVVMIECHDLTGQSPAIGSPDYVAVDAFWDEAADRYGDNTYVWFNHLNEFHEDSPELSGEENLAYWQEIIDDGYRSFVDRGVDNLLLFDMPRFGNDLSPLAEPEVQAWAQAKCNVVWDWHPYGAMPPDDAVAYDFAAPDKVAYEENLVSILDSISQAGIPIVAGEFGHDWDEARQQSNFQFASEQLGATTAIRHAPRYGFGLLVWHANGSSGTATAYGVKTSDSQVFAEPAPGEDLSSLGQLLWDYSEAQSANDVVPGPSTESCDR